MSAGSSAVDAALSVATPFATTMRDTPESARTYRSPVVEKTTPEPYRALGVRVREYRGAPSCPVMVKVFPETEAVVVPLVAEPPSATNALAGGNAPMVLAALYGTPVMFAVRGDSPHRDIVSLRGQPVLWGASGSNFVVAARQVMGSLGLDIEHDFRPVFVSHMADAPAMVLDGRVAALWGGGAGWPAFAGVAAGPRGVGFIVPTSEEQLRIVQAYPSLRPMSLPADSYNGQTAAIPSIGSSGTCFLR